MEEMGKTCRRNGKKQRKGTKGRHEEEREQDNAREREIQETETDEEEDMKHMETEWHRGTRTEQEQK